MRMLNKLLAGSAAAAALVALAAGPALADPPSGTTPRAGDAVGVGSNTDQFLFDQVSADFNKAKPKNPSLFYSWDATNPVTGAEGDQIETKNDCVTIARPNGSGAGVTALEDNTTDPSSSSNYCIDYARSSSGPSSTTPACDATGGVCYVDLAGDAVTWADRNAANGGTDAPASLTTADLVKIYECTVTNWDKVGGKNAPIEAFLPQTSSGTRTFFLTALGGGTTPITPGACVNDENNTLEENEGINPVLDSAEAIFIFSVGDYIGQDYHSAACLNSGCTGSPACDPTSSQNAFGCNETGVLGLGEINKVKPIAGTSASTYKINTSFDIAFQRSLYDVVRYDPNTTDHIPGSESGSPGAINLEQFFSAKTASTPGYFCSNATAIAAIKAYGFLPTWSLGTCGEIANA
jgi:ABC-type phosphate transport system substrate-binding protein